MQDERKLTFGEKAVGLTFNPLNNPRVDEIKYLYANIIDQLNSAIKSSPESLGGRSGKIRLLSNAITEAQGACMWAVKAITWED